MEENVALDSKKQKKFDKSIKGIKKLLKKNEAAPHKPMVLAPKDEDNKGDKKRKRKERGLVYLSHIPHGFYEHEMTQYFKQFGMVTNVRVIRSPRTGRSKGFAFVEFREPAVAEIVAETMNNYLMGKRLIKAAIIPPEKQKYRAFRKHWSSKNNPTTNRRVQERKAYNAPKTDAEHLKKAKKMLSNLQKNKKKLSDLGIDYSFFTPVDVPEELSHKVEVKVESDNKNVKVTQKKTNSEANKTKNEPEAKQNKNKKTKVKETEGKLIKDKKPETKSKPDTKNKKEVKKVQETDKAKQNEKQKKMQNAGVKLPENFIKVGEDSGEDSDSSLDFDSDEYEKMLENDSDASSGESEGSDDEEDSDDGEEETDDDEEVSDAEDSEEELPPLIQIKEKRGKKSLVAAPPTKATPATGATTQQAAQKQQAGQKQPPAQKKSPNPNATKVQKPHLQPQVLKRKNPRPEVSPKKPKFEKKDKPRNKQFKKKNKA